MQKIVSAAAWACLVFIALATLSPAHLRPGPTEDEPALIVFVEHVGAFSVLGLLFAIGYPRRPVFVCIAVLGSALVLELAQILIPDRDARIFDALEKMAGGVCGVIVGFRLCGPRAFSGRLRNS
jgi:VanZ family protein